MFCEFQNQAQNRETEVQEPKTGNSRLKCQILFKINFHQY